MGYKLHTYFPLCFLFVVGHIHETFARENQTPQKWAKNEEIQIFREYLRIPTVSTPKADYSKIKFEK